MPADNLVRKASVPERDRTPQRDDAADYIEDMWPEHSLREIAEESGFSRSHIQNTIDRYFEPADRQESHNGDTRTVEIDIPEGVDEKAYLIGWINGYTYEHNGKGLELLFDQPR